MIKKLKIIGLVVFAFGVLHQPLSFISLFLFGVAFVIFELLVFLLLVLSLERNFIGV